MNKAIAELVGTFTLVLFTVGALVFGGIESGLHFALAAGFVLIAAYVLVAGISGAHLNPAVTLGSLVAGRTSVADAIQYWIAQFVGGVAAVFVIWLLGEISDAGDIAFGGNVVPEGLDIAGTLILEGLLVLFFVLVYLKVSDGDNLIGRAVSVGLTFAAVYLVAGAATGGSANMAKSLGAAVFEGGDTDALEDLWVFIVAGAVGAVLAGLVHVALRSMSEDKESVSS
jgi:aquaporin Z